ncbi:hypothetical protein M3Y97_00758000 [Aphelenchoides bicaudatus]|nr:hypothetical protein M3Y97_00758000 [Aphelenchoides bicaudatus]
MSGTLRNEDFRKLLTGGNRSGGSSSYQSASSRNKSAGHGFTHKQAKNVGEQKKKKKSNYRPPVKPKEKDETDQLYEESEATLRDIMKNYRDRAAERRKGEIDGQDVELRAKLTSGLRAFRDEKNEDMAAADRREQEIRESKYLGGDIEHTHLVKGLDYSLLNKARSEMKNKKEEVEEQHDVEAAFQNPISKNALLNRIAQTKFSRAICKTLFEPLPLTKNDLFQRGRMAYVVELEEGQNDVPVTLLRSNFDCVNDKSEQNIAANSMLINASFFNRLWKRLSDVLSYLRSDGKRKKKDPAKEKEVEPEPNKKENIFDDVGEYRSDSRKRREPEKEAKESSDKGRFFAGVDKYDKKASDSRSRSDRDDRRRESRDDRKKDDRRNYFDDDRKNRDRDDRDSRRTEKYESRSSRDGDRRDRHSDTERKPAKVEHNPFPQTSILGTLPPEEPKPKKSRLDEEDAYGELFPSADMYYGGSDEEDDFSKMDMGTKKGPVNRWDFESEEAYESYQSGREAMPKAAFQFGVKTGAGRKTRKNAAMAEEKKLDREFERIEQIWSKGGSRPNF